jgi:putative ABC transport system substrate-binding protein
VRRRAFIALSAGTLAAPARSQAQPSVAPRVGLLVAGVPDPTLFEKEFREGLRMLGYRDGDNIVLDIRSAGSTDPSRLKAAAVELVHAKPAVIVCYQTPTARAVSQVTRAIPIVSESGDPVGTGLVASLAHPGGNVTGMSGATAETAGKNVEILREILPKARRIGALCNASDPFSKPFLARIESAGAVLGVEIRAVFAHGAGELAAAFEGLHRESVDAVVIQPSLGAAGPAALALKHRLPAASPHRPFAAAGGLVSYSANQPALFRRVATFVDKILKGAKPADLPVEEPSVFDLVVNLQTARRLSLTMPTALLARADEVIE